MSSKRPDAPEASELSDRERVLARRRFFVASALAGIAAVSCAKPDAKAAPGTGEPAAVPPTAEPVPSLPEDGEGAAADDASAGSDEPLVTTVPAPPDTASAGPSGLPPPPPPPPPKPTVCLRVANPKSQPCLLVAMPDDES
ncbi:MAG: hypothetical protein R3B13_10170 [Polyangiaceae bacterium]